ncbi:hypothetical protein LTR13_001066 [Exophiala sideris]|nr:hypothetical protein LTR13_001066 [Exophiala sideris]
MAGVLRPKLQYSIRESLLSWLGKPQGSRKTFVSVPGQGHKAGPNEETEYLHLLKYPRQKRFLPLRCPQFRWVQSKRCACTSDFVKPLWLGVHLGVCWLGYKKGAMHLDVEARLDTLTLTFLTYNDSEASVASPRTRNNQAMVSFNPSKDIPSLQGKVILVTGGNIGLGRASILEFSRHNPAQIWLAARNLDKARVTADEIKQHVPGAPIKLLELDLTSFESVKKAAKTFRAESDRLDILMCNAGIMMAPPGVTKEGYEIQFGTNHMGHALLTRLLLPVLEKTAAHGDADVRVVSMSSYGHSSAPKEGIVFGSLKTPAETMGSLERYGQSKLANILWARELARRYPQFTVAAVHPGVVNTNLLSGATDAPFWARMLFGTMRKVGFIASAETGVKKQLWAAVASDVRSGQYHEPVGVSGKGSAKATDDELAKRLWEWTEKELDGYVE